MNNSSFTMVLGLITGVVTVAAFMPQVLKIWRSKKARDVSYGTFSLLLIASASWVVYGYLRGDIVVLITNFIILLLTALIVILKFRFADHG